MKKILGIFTTCAVLMASPTFAEGERMKQIPPKLMECIKTKMEATGNKKKSVKLCRTESKNWKNMRRDKLKNMSYEERKEIIQKNRNNMTEEKKQKIKSLIQKRRQSKNEERNRRKYNNTSQ